MYVEAIPFKQDMPILFDAYKMNYYHLHCHEDVIEVLMVISGNAHVKVSFEQFYMKEGDFIIINNGDSHSIDATDSKCQTISLYYDMTYYRKQIPHLYYILFACESFDLAKFKNETHYLRRMIATVLLNLAKYNESSANELSRNNIKKIAEDLLWIFVNDYDMKNYYSRNWDAGYNKTEKYYIIMKYIFENYNMKNITEYISKNEYYSKSYITHLFKEVGASSFQDVLTYVRLYRSEKLLLDSDVPIIEIAEKCGFSDIKYYTRNFRKWFSYTPSEYRKIYQPEVLKNSLCRRINHEDVINRMEHFIRYSNYNTEYKAAITPLTIKGKDTWKQLFEGCDSEKNLDTKHKSRIVRTSADNDLAHQIFISIDDNSDIEDLISKFTSFKKAGFIPVFIINYKEMSYSRTNELLMRCLDIATTDKHIEANLEIVIAYSCIGDVPSINKLLESYNWTEKIILKPVLMV